MERGAIGCSGGGLGGEAGGSELNSVLCGGGGDGDVVALEAAKKRRTPFIYGSVASLTSNSSAIH